MADNPASTLPPVPPDHRRIAAESFDRANQVALSGNFDYAIQLLLTCCKIDPANLIYRQTLRRTEKLKYKNNLKGSSFSLLTNSAAKARLKAAKGTRDYLKVLENAEEVLARNPWDTGAQIDMAEAAAALGLLDLAIWTLEQARQKDPADVTINRALAHQYEKRGNFTHAIALWNLILKQDPSDQEAQTKSKDLAASDTIARGHYGESAGAETQDEEEPETRPVRPAPPPPLDRVSRERASFESRLEADATDASAYLQLAALHRRASRLDEAREVLQRGLGPTGNHFQLMVELMDLELEPFRRNLAVTEEKLRENAQDEELRRLRIRLLKEVNTRELELFRLKADRFPNDHANRLELGIRLLRGGQTDEAIHELQVARSDPRQQWRALMFLGYCFRSRNNWRLARRNFEDALKALPVGEDNPRKEILFQLAQGCADAGELATAIDLGTELANIDFVYRDIGRLLDEWQERLQQAS